MRDEFDIENQIGLGGNRAAPVDSVRKLVRNEKTAFAANLHSVEAFIPAGNDAMLTLDKVDWSAPINRGVELGAVMQPTSVVNAVLPAQLRRVAGSGSDVNVFEGDERLGNALTTGIFGGSFIAVAAAAVPAAEGLCAVLAGVADELFAGEVVAVLAGVAGAVCACRLAAATMAGKTRAEKIVA